MFLKTNIPVVLVICGVSGSGKSTLEQNLINEYPELFHKWQQFTTRQPRNSEATTKPYVFVQHKTFGIFENSLVGRIQGNHKAVNFGNKYGSIPDFVEGKISTVILSEEGLLDLIKALDDGRLNSYTEVIVMGLDVDYNDVDKEAMKERANRDEEFINKERDVLKFVSSESLRFKNKNGKYVSPNEVVNILESMNIVGEDKTNNSIGSYSYHLREFASKMLIVKHISPNEHRIGNESLLNTFWEHTEVKQNGAISGLEKALKEIETKVINKVLANVAK